MNDIEQLEISLEVPPGPQAEALAASISSRLLALPADAPQPERARAVRGLVALSHHYYRVGDLASAGTHFKIQDAS